MVRTLSAPGEILAWRGSADREDGLIDDAPGKIDEAQPVLARTGQDQRGMIGGAEIAAAALIAMPSRWRSIGISGSSA